MARPVAVTFDHDEVWLWWSDYERARDHVRHIGGYVDAVPDEVEEDDDDV